MHDYFILKKQIGEMIKEIIQTKKLTQQEQFQLFEWGKDIFGSDSQNLSWRPMELHFIFKVGGNSVGHLGLIREQISVEGVPFDIAGVGDVVTIPEMRGKGIARKLMAQATAFFFEEWKVDLGVLFCFERLVPYYQSLGWEIFHSPVYVLQPSGQIRFPNQVMTLREKDFFLNKGLIEINSFPW